MREVYSAFSSCQKRPVMLPCLGTPLQDSHCIAVCLRNSHYSVLNQESYSTQLPNVTLCNRHFDTTVIGQWSEQEFHSFLSDLCGLPFASPSTVWWPGTSTARSGLPPEREGDSGTSCETASHSPAPPHTRTNVWTETPRHGESTSAPAGSLEASSTWRCPRRSATDHWRSQERCCWPRSTDPRRCRHRGWSAPSWRRCEAWVCRGQGEGSGHVWPRNWWQMCRSRGCAQAEPRAVGHHPQCRNWKKKLYLNSTKYQLTFLGRGIYIIIKWWHNT